MRVAEYDYSIHYEGFVQLLHEYFSEVNPDTYIENRQQLRTVPAQLEESYRTIYILEDDDRSPVGFLVVFMNDQWGMLEKYVECEYMFITKEQRSGMATIHLFTMIGAICEDYDCGAVGNTYNTSANIKNNERVGGKAIATTFSFAYDDIVGTYKKYKRRIMNGKR